ncbi:MAG: hypothetical protein EHM85_08140 [Desulfobacteraceae bacterium]|nr:MAG: hypothetical protein EHM85_08140 [Desulfobacteraceae bacterium]
MVKKIIKSVLPKEAYCGLANIYRFFRPKKKWYKGMTSPQEQEYFEHYTKKIYSGLGEVVDLGCWLGSTTIPLAKGLARRRQIIKKNKKIHAFDRFIWENWMDRYAYGCYRSYRDGDSFLSEFEERTKQWSKLIKIHIGDLQTIGWDGGKIEFLLIDAMKSWELANSILKDFFPQLIPGHSYIVHQDFKHYYTSWIHLINYRFREYFTMIYNIPWSASIVLKYIKPINEQLLKESYSFESFSPGEIDEAFNYSMSLVPKEEHSSIAAAKVMLYIHLKQEEKAREELKKFLSQGVSSQSEIAIVMNMLP